MADDKETITFLVAEPEEDESLPGLQLIPGASKVVLKTVTVSVDALRTSIQKLTTDVNLLFQSVAADAGPARLDQVSVAVQVTSQGGIQWIASLGGAVQGTMTVSFKLRKSTDTQHQNMEHLI